MTTLYADGRPYLTVDDDYDPTRFIELMQEPIMSLNDIRELVLDKGECIGTDRGSNCIACVSSDDRSYIEPYRPVPCNCVNCGAPLRGMHRCEYCDTCY